VEIVVWILYGDANYDISAAGQMLKSTK